jgi:disulfide bond formation protein DsbB
MSTSANANHQQAHDAKLPDAAPLSLIWPSLLVALVALAGSLWLSIGMHLRACPLCFYQRTFVMGIVAVLAVGLFTGRHYRAVLNLLALPMAVAGLGVALFHVYLEGTGKLECPAGILDLGTSPQQSLAALTLLFALIVVACVRSGTLGEAPAAGVLAVVVGVLLAWGSIASSPPMPPAPAQPHATPLDICRPPFQPK